MDLFGRRKGPLCRQIRQRGRHTDLACRWKDLACRRIVLPAHRKAETSRLICVACGHIHQARRLIDLTPDRIHPAGEEATSSAARVFVPPAHIYAAAGRIDEAPDEVDVTPDLIYPPPGRIYATPGRIDPASGRILLIRG